MPDPGRDRTLAESIKAKACFGRVRIDEQDTLGASERLDQIERQLLNDCRFDARSLGQCLDDADADPVVAAQVVSNPHDQVHVVSVN